MIKHILIVVSFIFVVTSSAFAFNYGTDTYATDGSQLILNSLGDQVTNSTFGNLGSNDFISENAVKNTLAMDGYTKAYDYNPQNTNGQFSANYNVALPTGVELTKLTFAGFEGDPRKTQDVYVLTSEYNRLSAEGQATSIDTLNTTVVNQENEIAQNVRDINKVEEQSVNRDQTLQKNINKEAKVRAKADAKLQANIDTESAVRAEADNNLQDNINTVDTKQTTWNQTQDQQIASNSAKIDQVDNRVKKLEQTQGVVGAEVRVYDGQKWTITTFVDYTTTRNTVDRAGVRFTYKVGKSWEEKRIDELEAKLNHVTSFSQGKAEQPEGKFYTSGSTIGIHEQF